MKKIILLIALFYSAFAFSQNFVMTWNHCYGGTADDDVHSIIPYKDGYLFFGTTKSHDGDVTNNPVGGAAWLVHIDAVGNKVFDTCYVGMGGHANGIKILKNGTEGFYFLGDTSPNNPHNSNGYWLAKADTNFNIIWQDVYGGSGQEMIRGGCLSHNGGIIEVGISASTDGDKEVSYGFHDDWAVNLNSDGSKNWIKTYGNAGVNEGGNIIQTSDGGYMLTASGQNRLPGNIYCEGHDETFFEAWAIKLNIDGEIEWSKCFGGSYGDSFNHVVEIEDGYIFTGVSMSYDGDLPGHYGEVDDAYDLWLVKTNKHGDIIWSKNYGGTDWDVPYKIFENTDNTNTILGITTSHNYDVQGNNAPNNYYAVWMLKIDENGDMIYQKPFDELFPISDFPDFIRISDYKYIAAVTKQLDGCHGFSNEDIYIIEIQDLDEFIPSQPAGANNVCLGIETETYYSCILVVDTMETQWLLEPAEAGVITEIHDSVLIHWNIDFNDTAWLKVKSINQYGESSYSSTKEIIVYQPINLSEIIGTDTICTVTNEQTIFTTSNPESLNLNWHINPTEAGTIITQEDTAIIIWDSFYEGAVELKTSTINNCEDTIYSPTKVVQIKTCLATNEPNYSSLKVYPNPANEYIIFILPQNAKQNQLTLTDIYGRVIKKIPIKENQKQIKWDCKNIKSGVYFYKTEIHEKIYKGKILIE